MKSGEQMSTADANKMTCDYQNTRGENDARVSPEARPAESIESSSDRKTVVTAGRDQHSINEAFFMACELVGYASMLDVHGPRLTMMAKRIRDLLEPLTSYPPQAYAKDGAEDDVSHKDG